MVESSFAALFACLLPFLLYHFNMDEEEIWSVCSGALLAIEIWLGGSAPWRTRRAEVNYALPDWSRTVAVINYGVTILSALVQVVNLAVMHAFGPYLLGIGLVLVRAAVQFARLVFVAVRGPAA